MPNLSNTVTFLFASDGSLASDGLSAFLQTKSNFLLLSECNDGATTIADIQAHKPEIAVIDAQLPDMDAQHVIEAVRIHNWDTKIIVLGASPDRTIADELLSNGADAYIVRNGPSRHLNDAIRYVRDGGKYLAPQLTQNLPVLTNGHSSKVQEEGVSSLHAAVEAQARTVARLEHAMDRAQCAIDLLQQKVEKLATSPIEPPTPATNENERSRKKTGVRAGMSAVAASFVLGVLGFQLAGILRPSPASSGVNSSAAVDAARTSSNALVNEGEWDKIESARQLLRDQHYAAAEKLCRIVLKQNPTSATAQRILASALFHQNRISESADVISTITVSSTRAVR